LEGSQQAAQHMVSNIPRGMEILSVFGGSENYHIDVCSTWSEFNSTLRLYGARERPGHWTFEGTSQCVHANMHTIIVSAAFPYSFRQVLSKVEQRDKKKSTSGGSVGTSHATSAGVFFTDPCATAS
jgi:hypothetical protein